jgi:two-component system, NtrC family, sensor kinase
LPTRTLTLKLILLLTFLVAIIEGIFSFFTVREQERQILQSMILGADQLSRSITSATWQSMLADHRSTAYEVMQTIAQKQGIDRIRIFNKEGRVMYSTASPEVGSQVDEHAEACFLCHAKEKPLVKVDVPSRARIFSNGGGHRKLGMVTPIYNEPACSNASCHAHHPGRNVLGVLDLTLNLEPVDRQLSRAKLRTGLVVALEVVVLGAFIIVFIRRVVHRPIKKLIAGTKAVGAMQLDRPIRIDAPEELRQLADSFNVMRERLLQARKENEEFTQSLESRVKERTDQLKAAQQKLIQNDRLASLGQLSASVAHEINNPVSGVLNLSMLMQRILRDDGIPPRRVQEFRGYLGQVTQETSRVGRIVSDLLAFSRRARPQSGPADLNALIQRTASLVSHKMELAGVRLEMDLQPGLPQVPCDGSQMQQVIMNLMLNGTESIKGGGTVAVSTRAAPGADWVTLEVRDTGTGIPPEILPKIFDPFFTTKEEGKGVGLGLAVVYGIISAHGGDIEVESPPGRGATFRVMLPLAGDAAGAAAARPPAAAPAGRGPWLR